MLSYKHSKAPSSVSFEKRREKKKKTQREVFPETQTHKKRRGKFFLKMAMIIDGGSF